jgi:uncharacterized protein YqeY
LSLSEKIIEDLKDAMKHGQEVRKNVLRMLKSQIRNKEIECGSKLTEEDEIQILNSAVKTRKESLELYKKGDRQDLVENESLELEIVQSYLPKPLSEEELQQAVNQLITEMNVSSMKDMGLVIKEMMSRYRGKVDGKKVQELVRLKLS